MLGLLSEASEELAECGVGVRFRIFFRKRLFPGEVLVKEGFCGGTVWVRVWVLSMLWLVSVGWVIRVRVSARE